MYVRTTGLGDTSTASPSGVTPDWTGVVIGLVALGFCFWIAPKKRGA